MSEFCDSSVGTDFGTHFRLESSASARLDFPEVGRANENNLSYGEVLLSFRNLTGTTVPMNLWLDSSPLQAIDLAFPPTDGWGTVRFDLQGAHQFSITGTGDNGAIDIQQANYSWLTSWQFDNFLEIGSCPSQPLPGIGDAEPQAPTARLQGRADPCGPWQRIRVISQVANNVEFEASQSTDPNIEQLYYFWDFQDGHTGEGEQVVHAFAEPGVYFIELTATDPSGLSDRERLQVEIKRYDSANSSPVAVIEANRTNLLWPHTSTTLRADTSYDQDGDPLDHVWYNGFTEAVVHGPEIQLDLSDFPYSSQTISLGVSDGRGGTDVEKREVFVAEYPGADCEVTYHSHAFDNFTMDVKIYNNTSTPVQAWQATWHTAEPVSQLENLQGDLYTLAVADQREFTVSGEAIAEHSWVSIQLFGRSDAAVQDIDFQPQNGMTCIENMPPRRNQRPVARLTATPDSGDVPLTVYFSGEDSFDPEGDPIVSYLWDFGDGTHAFGPSVNHTYTASGYYDVRLTVSESPLSVWGDSQGGLYPSDPISVRVTGDQNIGCRARITPTDQTQNEYFVDVWYWFKPYTNMTESAHLNSGQITLSRPVWVKQANAEAGFNLNTPLDVIDFPIDKLLDPAGTVDVRMIVETDEIDQLYFTGCTFN